MRGWAVAIGGLLLVGGAALVVVADQQRAAEVAEIEQRVEVVSARLDQIADDNMDLARQLTRLRSQIALQDAAIADETGFLR